MSSAAIKLFQPGASPPGASNLTLREAFIEFLLPEISNAGTLSIYETALRHWERLTDNPDIRTLTADRKAADAFVREFREKLSNDPLGAKTSESVAKYWRHLRAIFRRVSQPHDRNPQGEGLIDRTPYLRLPKRRRNRRKRIATHDELSRLYNACHAARWPRSNQFSTCDLWRTIVVCLPNTGPRSWDLFSRGWSDVSWERKTLRFTQQKTGEEIEVPLGRVVLAHLSHISGDRKRIFPFTLARGYVYGEWTRIKQAANVDPTLEFQHLRATCQTWFDCYHMGLGDWMTGHAEIDVGGFWYRDLWEKAVQAVDAIQQPPAFLEGMGSLQENRQLTLF